MFHQHIKHEHELTIRTSVTHARKAWKPPYDIVLLDHDLGGETYVPSENENTGATFVRDLCQAADLKDMADLFIVHSWNPDGSHLMANLLLDAGTKVIRLEFGKPLLDFLSKISDSEGKLNGKH